MVGDTKLLQDARDIQSLASGTLGILGNAMNLSASLIGCLPRDIQGRIRCEGPDHDSTSIPWLWKASAAAPSACEEEPRAAVRTGGAGITVQPLSRALRSGS